MKVMNAGDATRTLSRDGKDHILPPGTSVAVPLSADEAEALRGTGFEVTGEPEKAPEPVRKGKGE